MKKSTKHSSNNVCGRGKRIIAFTLSAVFLTACCPIAFAEEDSSAPLTPEQISGMTYEQLAAIPQEQSDATLNKITQLWWDGKSNEFDKYLSALGFATTYEEYTEQQDEQWNTLNPGIQPLWSSDYDEEGGGKPEEQCHELITGSGFFVYMAARNIAFNGGDIGYTLADLSLLGTASEEPDKKDPGILFDSHFYNPDTGTNWRGDASPTARTKAEGYYDVAVKIYTMEHNDGSRERALQSLGHCLHFVQDAGEPHHASNKVAGLSNHSSFETEAAQWLYDGTLIYDLESDFEYDPNFYNSFLNRTVGESVHEIAIGAKSLIDAAESSAEGTRKLAAYFSAGISMQYTAGILYKFARDVGMI